jgi:heme oxygenase (biliverdin-IX-beta and delta-forming)
LSDSSYERLGSDLRCSSGRPAKSEIRKKKMQFDPTPAQGPATLLRLRAATATHHAAIESRLRLGESLTLAHYVEVLHGFDAFLQGWEGLVARSVPLRLRNWTKEGLRHGRLRNDLRALGVAQRAAPAVQLALPTRAAAMGSLYVLEGSALGAQVISPRLQTELGLHAGNGGSYFSCDATESARRWRDFRFLLEQEVATPSARQQACIAAVATFESLLAVFEPLADAATPA